MRWLILSVVLLPGLALAEKNRWDMSGRLLLDADYFEEFHSKDADSSNTQSELRNARLQVDYDLPKKWEVKLQVDADEEDVELGSTYLRYTGWKFADVSLGKMKEPLGLERNTSGSKLLAIEGSMMSRAFTPGKSWGVHLYRATKDWRWALAAVVEDDQDDDYDEDEPQALTGRYTRTLYSDAQGFMQVGASASLRDWNDNTYQVRRRAEVNTADKVVRSAAFLADQQSILGLEGSWGHGGLMLQAEYMLTRVEDIDGTDWDYDGYYVTASYFLTGESHRLKKGEFRSVRPMNESGAWELIARYSEIDLRDHALGSVSSVSRLGVNYYYTHKTRLMFNVLYADVSGDTRHTETDGYAASMRLQFLF